jgi:serine/threonine-protein kinase RsbW
MPEPSREPKVHLEIGSRLENVELVQIAVEAALQQLSVEEVFAHQVGTAIREAVANAIEHGNQSDSSKQVEIDFCLEGDEIVIEVTDEGEGFDPGKVPDPLEAENLLKPNGRGILLIREFMDEVEYRFNGNRGTALVMRKHMKLPRAESDTQQEDRE